MLKVSMSVWGSLRRYCARALATLVIIVFFGAAALAAAVISFSTFFPPEKPLNLTPLLPRVNDYLAAKGIHVAFEKLVTYYADGEIVLDARDVRVYGGAGELAMTLENAKVALSRHRLFAGIPAPKSIWADGVTLRVIRGANGIHLAGMGGAAPDDTAPDMGGVVEWLNSTTAQLQWGVLETANVDNLNLLLRDDVEDTDWVLEGATLAFTQTSEEGQRGVLDADLRRLYGETKRTKNLPKVMPVQVVFDHASGAEDATVRARFEKSDVAMVADYFPEQIRKMFKAQGKVEVGVRLTEGNVMGQPWLTLRLNDVTVTPPALFSKALKFKTFDVTVSYVPSPTDVLTVTELNAVDTKGLTVRGKGSITGITGGDPMVEARLLVPQGAAQALFNYFPDQYAPFIKPLAWLRPNIKDAHFSGLVLHYSGRPTAFPFCGVECGLTITARIDDGKVRYLPNLPWATVTTSGTFTLAGETIRVQAPTATSGLQKASTVDVTLEELFTPVPTVLGVKLNLQGPLDDVVREVSKIDKPIPIVANGNQTSALYIRLPFITGKETKLTDADITLKSDITDLALTRVGTLKNTAITAANAQFRMEGPTAFAEGKGALNGGALTFTWQDDWKTPGAHAMKLKAKGVVPSDWLAANGLPSGVRMDGPLSVDVSLDENGPATAFTFTADASRAALNVEALKWSKAKGLPLDISARGKTTNDANGRLAQAVITALNLDGKGINTQGDITYVPDNLSASLVNLEPFVLGDTNARVEWDGQKLTLRGQQLDLRGLDLTSSGDSDLPNFALDVDVRRMLFAKGELANAKGMLVNRDKVMDIGSLTGVVNGQRVAITQTLLPGQVGRRRLAFDVSSLGDLLNVVGLYDKMIDGQLTGDITYDAPGIGGGVLTIKNFKLDNPPLLARVLSLLSLEQILRGTDKLVFDKAIIPIRLEKNMVYLDKMVAEGPAMTIRLDGRYNRQTKDMDMNGKLTPALPFNRVIAKIPLIGNILAGSQDGVVVADFKMRGSSDDPQIDVRPLSVLTPGLLKDIFR